MPKLASKNIQGICILGSTGTIGVNTLDVIKRHADKYSVIALTANLADEKLFQQCLDFNPRYAVLVNDDAAQRLKTKLDNADVDTQVLCGVDALEKVAALDEVDQVMAAIVGAAGLLPTLAAARAGKRILLANKEALVMSGDIFIKEVAKHNAELLPIDSEHNAIFQCMPTNFESGLEKVGVNKILLTASGGPFRTRSIDTLCKVTPEEAVAHPNWVMGKKISVDSATMMNKGLEVIEACWLFNTRPSMIQVVLHSQSIIHSMVSYTDGSVLAQMGNPDMRTPIAYGLAWPDRIDSGVSSLDLFSIASLNFEKPDHAVFPCLNLAQAAFKVGGASCATLNAANEQAVDAFLKGNIPFYKIPDIIERVLSSAPNPSILSIADVVAADSLARNLAQEEVSKLISSKVSLHL